MVKSQLWEFVDGKPLGLCRVILPFHFHRLFYQGQISNRYRASSWVAIDFTIGSYLRNLGYHKTRFFPQLTNGALFRRLVHIQESARNGPAPFVRVVTSLDKENLRILVYVQRAYGKMQKISPSDYDGYFIDNCSSGKAGENMLPKVVTGTSGGNEDATEGNPINW